MATVTTSKTYCDRPGCGAEVQSENNGCIRFNIYINRRGYSIPASQKGFSDLCKSCAVELDKYWHGKDR